MRALLYDPKTGYRVDFFLENVLPLGLLRGRGTIPTPPGHRLVKLNIDIPGGRDYVVYKGETGEYLFRILKKKGRKIPSEVNIRAAFLKEPEPPPEYPPLSEIRDLDKEKMLQEVKLLKDAGFTELGGRLESEVHQAKKANRPFSLSDLEGIMVSEDFYSTYPASKRMALPLQNPYKAYREYRNANGEFCAICNGHSDLFGTIAKRLLMESENLKVEQVGSWHRWNEDSELLFEKRHSTQRVRDVRDDHAWRFDPTRGRQEGPRADERPAESNEPSPEIPQLKSDQQEANRGPGRPELVKSEENFGPDPDDLLLPEIEKLKETRKKLADKARRQGLLGQSKFSRTPVQIAFRSSSDILDYLE